MVLVVHLIWLHMLGDPDEVCACYKAVVAEE